MKKIVTLIMCAIMALTCGIALTACGNESYTAAAEFYYSADAGATYGNRTKEYAVGETVYMQIIAKVTSTSKDETKVTMTLTIPNIDAVSATYFDGQIITPTKDEVNNVTYYEFTIFASKNAVEQNFVFQFIPNKASTVQMKLEFDDHVDALYDRQNTITFIEAQQPVE